MITTIPHHCCRFDWGDRHTDGNRGVYICAVPKVDRVSNTAHGIGVDRVGALDSE